MIDVEANELVIRKACADLLAPYLCRAVSIVLKLAESMSSICCLGGCIAPEASRRCLHYSPPPLGHRL